MSANWVYSVDLRREADSRIHGFSDDLPEAIASGTTEAEALAEMGEAIAASLRGRMKDGMDLPRPRPDAKGDYRIFLPAPLAAKAAIYLAWKTANLSKVAVAQRMGRTEGEVRRIPRPRSRHQARTARASSRSLGRSLEDRFRCGVKSAASFSHHRAPAPARACPSWDFSTHKSATAILFGGGESAAPSAKF
jgi:antitoxin HicB